jgi:hypothetical protein
MRFHPSNVLGKIDQRLCRSGTDLDHTRLAHLMVTPIFMMAQEVDRVPRSREVALPKGVGCQIKSEVAAFLETITNQIPQHPDMVFKFSG